MTAKTSAERQKESDDRQRAMGRVGRKLWANTLEHEAVADFLAKYRRKQERAAKRGDK